MIQFFLWAWILMLAYRILRIIGMPEIIRDDTWKLLLAVLVLLSIIGGNIAYFKDLKITF